MSNELSNEEVFDKNINRLFRLWSAICKMIVDGVRDPGKVAEALQAIVDESAAVTMQKTTHLRRLFTVTLGATSGKDNYASARKVFGGYFDPNFENWGINFSGIAPETELATYELIADGKFSDFLSNSAAELEKRHLLGSQFLELCRSRPERLRQGGRANFVVLTKGDKPVEADLSNVFVTRAYVYDDGRLRANILKFSYERVWDGDRRLRVFSPKQ